jgi:phytoene synthase
MQDNYNFCKALIRAVDKDRFLASLFAPEALRPHFFALYAFNFEIARVRELVSEPMLGELRLQWWRDALEGTAPGELARPPVAGALIETIEHCRLPRPPLLELIDARTFDLYDDPMPTLTQLESYADSTSGALIRLAAFMLLGKYAPGVAQAATPAGRAYAITGLLRAYPLHASRRQLFVPLDLLKRHGVDRDEALAGNNTGALSAALAELRALARTQLDEARTRIAELPAEVGPAFLPLALVPLYLKRMEKPGYDPFKIWVEVAQWRRQWALWRAARGSLT